MTAATVPSSLATSSSTTIPTRELELLAAEAQTPAEHRRIAQYYETKAQDYFAQAHVYEAILTSLPTDAATWTSRCCDSTLQSSQYFAMNYLALASKSERLAELHRKLASN